MAELASNDGRIFQRGELKLRVYGGLEAFGTALPPFFFGEARRRGHRESKRSDPLDSELHDFRAIFDAHAAFAWRVLSRHGVREPDLEDACQEVFLVVNARLGEFEGRSSLRTWIYGIAVRVALGLRRKRARRREQLSPEPPEQQAEAEQLALLEQRQTMEQIERALSRLAAPKREVFALYELEGMTMAEVASTLCLPENTALYRLYAARDELKSLLSRQEHARPITTRRAMP